jgi:hypothetical protein
MRPKVSVCFLQGLWMRLAPVPFSLLLVFTTLAASLHPLRAFGTSFLQRARRPTLCRRMETLAGVTLPDVKTKHLTLVLVRQMSDQGVPQLLLGMKKRGFGKGTGREAPTHPDMDTPSGITDPPNSSIFESGKYNGFGGKVEPGETIEQAALRELLEESCLKAERVRKRGDLAFLMAGPEVLVSPCFALLLLIGVWSQA